MSREADPDPKLALRAADAWLRFALLFIEEIGTDMETAHKRAYENLGGMVVSATQLLTAVEYYLRALGMRLKLELTRKHELLPLFRVLPKELQDRIEHNRQELPPPPEGHACGLELVFYVSAPGAPPPPPPTNDPPRPAAKDSAELVRRYSNLVNDWRFLFERGAVGQYKRLHYDFADLRRLALAIRQTILEMDPSLAPPNRETLRA